MRKHVQLKKIGRQIADALRQRIEGVRLNHEPKLVIGSQIHSRIAAFRLNPDDFNLKFFGYSPTHPGLPTA